MFSFRFVPAANKILVPGDILILVGIIGISLSLVLAVYKSPGQFPWDVMGGTGKVDNPYLISSCVQLQNMAKDPTASYALAADINCEGTSAWDDGHGFFPIGYYGFGFSGTFDGRGHPITNLFMRRESLDYAGMFGKLSSSAHIYDLSLDVDITAHDEVGGLAGWSSGANIERVSVTGSVIGNNGVGGVLGVNQGTMKEVTSGVIVKGGQWVGGLAGLSYEASSVLDSTVKGSITGQSEVGGLLGVSRGATVERCLVSASIDGESHVGGIVGWLVPGVHTAAVVKKCTFTGKVNNSASGAELIGAQGVNPEE